MLTSPLHGTPAICYLKTAVSLVLIDHNHITRDTVHNCSTLIA